MFPVGDLQKSQVRELASRINLRTADKPDSQDVCFIMSTKRWAHDVPRRSHPVPSCRGGRHVRRAGSARSRRSSWSRSVSARGSGCPAVDRSATSSTSTRRLESSPSATTSTCSVRALDVRSMTWVDEPVSRRRARPVSAHGEPTSARPSSRQLGGHVVVRSGTTRNAASPPARASCSTTSPTPKSSAAASPPDARR